jgi:hypothetical protein
MRYARVGGIALAVVGLVLVGACDDDTREKARETAESVKEEAGEAGARAAVEWFRASIKAQDTNEANGGVRNIEVLREAAKDLPGDPEITGIADADWRQPRRRRLRPGKGRRRERMRHLARIRGPHRRVGRHLPGRLSTLRRGLP